VNNWQTDAAWSYHERTMHSHESVRASRHVLDWSNRPHSFKEYLSVESVRFPEALPRPKVPALDAIAEVVEPDPAARPSFADLARILRWGAGLIRTRRLPGGEGISSAS
jgi:hypothetical protein